MWGLSGFRRWRRLRTQEQLLQQYAVGINSTVDVRRDKHVIFLDYDLVSIKEVEESVRDIQLFWGLSHFFIYKTNNGYHAIGFFDHIPYSRLKMIIEYADGVDDMFRYISRFYNHKTLRVCGKYKQRDISFVKVAEGVRCPTKEEKELGMLKYKEHCALSGLEEEFDEESLFNE